MVSRGGTLRAERRQLGRPQDGSSSIAAHLRPNMQGPGLRSEILCRGSSIFQARRGILTLPPPPLPPNSLQSFAHIMFTGAGLDRHRAITAVAAAETAVAAETAAAGALTAAQTAAPMRAAPHAGVGRRAARYAAAQTGRDPAALKRLRVDVLGWVEAGYG